MGIFAYILYIYAKFSAMKYTLSILLLFVSLVATSKKLPVDDDDKATFTKTIDVPDRSADEISLYASSFAKKNNLTDITVSPDTVGKKVTAKISWTYKGTKNNCIGTMVIEAELVVACRDHEAIVFITNITYRHYPWRSQVPKKIKVNKNREYCDSTGSIESLMDCPQCRGSQKKVYKMIKKNSKQFLSDYRDRMKDPESEKVNW